ncbi:MAG: ATPase AAA [bacterium]|nr:MAG: ATPase AAA [bacterium]
MLIDEIDKADIDFPNDLLSVLDDPWEFDIPETGEVFTAKQHKPIIIITSNKEKGNLPAPFLRRCIYYFIQFPNKESLKEIIDQHYKGKLSSDQAKEFSTLSNEAIDRFFTLREKDKLHKNPGTSEFLDWLKMLQTFHSTPYNSTKLKTDTTIPYPELLLKLRADWLTHTKAYEQS